MLSLLTLIPAMMKKKEREKFLHYKYHIYHCMRKIRNLRLIFFLQYLPVQLLMQYPFRAVDSSHLIINKRSLPTDS